MRKYPIQQSINHLSELYQNIKMDFENNNMIDLQKDIEEYEHSINDANLVSIKSNAYFQSENMKKLNRFYWLV